MKSITKRHLEEQTIDKLVQTAFNKQHRIATMKELKDGYFNISYYIQLDNGQEVVLKVAPKDGVKVLSYEKNLMGTEVFVLKQISNIKKIPTPKLLFSDDHKKIIDSDYFFMDYVEGVTLNKVRDNIPEDTYRIVSKNLGSYAKSIANITGEYFGFINLDNRRYSSWYECFRMMIADLMDDAKMENVHLPFNKVDALAIVEKYQTDLANVNTPSLIHKDLWDGNIFVDSRTFAITGIIDYERALYADKLLEAVCGFLDSNEFFMSRYYGKVVLSDSEYARINLYKFYLFLLMVIECYYREYENNDQESWARKQLDIVVDVL